MTCAPKPIEWVSVLDRVPDTRRRVLVWVKNLLAMWPSGAADCWAVSQYNRSHIHGKGRFECEGGLWWPVRVTHWADIEGPQGQRSEERGT